jgi:hypothetical protein
VPPPASERAGGSTEDSAAGTADLLAVYARVGPTRARPSGARPSRRRRWVLVLAGAIVAVAAVRVAQEPGEPIAEPVRTPPPAIASARPSVRKVTLRAGDEQAFRVAAHGADLAYAWTIDDRPAAEGPEWTYVARPGDVGRRRIDVAVAGATGVTRRSWFVRVKPARPPRLLVVEPVQPHVDVVAGSPVTLRVSAEPTARNETLRTAWLVDGAAVGEGETFTFAPERPVVVRAQVQSDLGPVVRLEWHLEPTAPPEPPAPRPLARRDDRPTTTPPRSTPPDATESEPPRVVPEDAAPPAEPPVVATPDDDIRRWLGTYADAWRAHDVDALRRMGQVRTDAQAAALREYFARVRDLDVQLNVLAVEAGADGATVRFTRRDRFKDPAGRTVVKESPPLTKELVRTPDGLRFAHPES